MIFLRSLSVSLVAITLALGGCAASSSEDAASANESAVSAEAKITVANYVSHPKIVAIREAVGDINGLASTELGCGRKKSEDAHGQIRKFESTFGEGNDEWTETSYYNEAGTLIFAFIRGTSLDDTETGIKPVHGTEHRVYFEKQGNTNTVLFEAVREGTPNGSGALVFGADRLPKEFEKFQSTEAMGDPAKLASAPSLCD